MKFKKGDKVIITVGKDKGKEGVIERIYDKTNKVLIPDINMVKKHMRKSEDMPQGGIIDMPKPIHASNVMLKDPKTGKATRIAYEIKDDKKVRIAKKSKSVLK